MELFANMRNYFSFNLKTKAVLLPILAGWVVFFCFSVTKHLLFDGGAVFAATETVNGQLVLNLLAYALMIYVALVVVASLMYFIVERSVSALGYKESAFDTDFHFGEYMKQILPDALFTVVTVGVYAPWFLTRVMCYFSRRIVHGGNILEFEGKPMSLFNILILLYVLPAVVFEVAMKRVETLFMEDQGMLLFWCVLLVGFFFMAISMYTAGLYVKWMLRGWYGNRRIISTVSMWDGGWYVFGQLLLTVITLGLYAPAASLKLWRYFAQSVVVGTDKVEGRFGMDLSIWRDWLYVLGQMLLLIVTLGVYMPWYYTKLYNRFIPRLYVESVDRPIDPMSDF